MNPARSSIGARFFVIGGWMWITRRDRFMREMGLPRYIVSRTRGNFRQFIGRLYRQKRKP